MCFDKIFRRNRRRPVRPSRAPSLLSETVKLESRDGKIFEIPLKVAFYSKVVLQHVLESTDEDEQDLGKFLFKFNNVEGHVLKKVIEWMEHCQLENDGQRLSSGSSACVGDNSGLTAWEINYLRMNNSLMGKVSEAAEVLQVDGLQHLVTATLVNKLMAWYARENPEQAPRLQSLANENTHSEEIS